MDSKPLKFHPLFKTVVWGGDKIAPFKGLKTGQTHIGESWELSGVKGDESIVSEGIYAGRSIAELAGEFKEELLGASVYERTGTEFPLLIKFIDAMGDLSIQVHPDDTLAATRHQSKGKTEMWYVVGASEGAHLLSGLSRELTPDQYEAMVNDGTITDALCRYDVREGDVFYLPAGRIHAICGGCFIAEIQQTSNITYRIYDYGRKGLDGRPRQLHTELAKAAIDYSVSDSYRTQYTKLANRENVLVECDYFITSLYELTEPLTKELCDIDSFVTVICTRGGGTVNGTAVHQGETLLIPACADSIAIVPDGTMTLLTSHL